MNYKPGLLIQTVPAGSTCSGCLTNHKKVSLIKTSEQVWEWNRITWESSWGQKICDLVGCGQGFGFNSKFAAGRVSNRRMLLYILYLKMSFSLPCARSQALGMNEERPIWKVVLELGGRIKVENVD